MDKKILASNRQMTNDLMTNDQQPRELPLGSHHQARDRPGNH